MPRPLSLTVTASPLLCSVTVMASAIAVEVFVDGVIDDFPDEVMQPLGVHAADVHRRPFAHGFQAFENGNVLGGVSGSTHRQTCKQAVSDDLASDKRSPNRGDC